MSALTKRVIFWSIAFVFFSSVQNQQYISKTVIPASAHIELSLITDDVNKDYTELVANPDLVNEECEVY